MVDFTRLQEFEDLFGHKWDALVLLCLAEGPLRFNQLAAAMDGYAEERFADNALTRSLRRLERVHLIQVLKGGERFKAYALTDIGACRAARLSAILHTQATGNVPTRPTSRSHL